MKTATNNYCAMKTAINTKSNTGSAKGLMLAAVATIAASASAQQCVPLATAADAAETIEHTSYTTGKTYRLVVDDYGTLETIAFPTGYNKLVFHDSFNGTGLPDGDKWSFEEGKHINSEMQYYVGPRIENCFMEDGALHLRCRANDPIYDAHGNKVSYYADAKPGGDYDITSASISTKGHADWCYCYLEARIKVPVGVKGTWPAVWMMPTNNEYGYWPRSGEIDIMEHVGYNSGTYNCALHHYSGDKGGNKALLDPGEWHVIALEWTPEKIDWLIDGKVYTRVKNPNTNWGDWPYDKDFYLILNFAFGGGWGGQQGIEVNKLPLDFLVDYVRVFQK